MKYNNSSRNILLPLLLALALLTGIIIGVFLPGANKTVQQHGFRARNDKINSILNII